MVTYATAAFNSAVKSLKDVFKGDEGLYGDGQFYITNRVIDAIVHLAQDVINSSIRFSIDPNTGKRIVQLLKQNLQEQPLKKINLGFIDRILASYDVNGDMARIREMLADEQPGDAERRLVQSAYNIVWSTAAIGTYLPLSSPTIKLARAALTFEADRCFSTSVGFARKLFASRKITTLAKDLRIHDALLARPRFTGPPAGPGPFIGQQIISYSNPKILDARTAAMRSVVDARAVVQCGVESGVRMDQSFNQQPEHYVLVFAYDDIDGQNAFLFWDPDTASSYIKSENWGPGFGVLFSRTGRLTTAVDDTDLTNIDRKQSTPTDFNPNFGFHLTDPTRHLYQVYWLATLPL